MNKSYQPIADMYHTHVFCVVYSIKGFDQEFTDIVMAMDVSEAVERSFNNRESKHPEINWDYMFDKYGDDKGTSVTHVEEYRFNMTHYTW